MNTTAAEERLEILKDGSHLGWVDVANGRWSFSASGLSVGVYRFTAKYKGKESLPWAFTVRETTDRDNFEDAPLGNFQLLRRPHFTVRLIEGDAWGSNASPSFNSLQISPSPSSMGSGSRSLFFCVRIRALDYTYRYPKQIVEIAFDEDYSSVSFSALPSRIGTVRYSDVVAFDRAGASMQTASFVGWQDSVRAVTMNATGGRKIARLIFSQSASASSVTNADSLFLDNFVMTI